MNRLGAAVAGVLVFVLTLLVAMLPAGVLISTEGCSAGELAAVKSDLQAAAADDAKLDGAFCAPIEAASQATAAAPYVDGICVLARTLGQVAGDVAQAIPGPVEAGLDAGPPLVKTSPFALHVSVRRDVAQQWYAAHAMPAPLRAIITGAGDGDGGDGGG